MCTLFGQFFFLKKVKILFRFRQMFTKVQYFLLFHVFHPPVTLFFWYHEFFNFFPRVSQKKSSFFIFYPFSDIRNWVHCVRNWVAKSVFCAVQGAFLHGSSQFLVCELLVGGRWGRQNDFFEIHIFRVKNGKISNRNCAFLAKSVFSQYRVHFFMDITIFGPQVVGR